MKKKNVSKGAVKKSTDRKAGTKGTGKRVKHPLNIGQDKIFELVRTRAYELYCTRSPNSGDEVSDWVRAEKIVRTELGLRA